MDRISQTQYIQDLLRKGKTITSFEAFQQYRITRLGAIIHVLITKKGWDISSTDEKNDETGTIYSRYKLISAPALSE